MATDRAMLTARAAAGYGAVVAPVLLLVTRKVSVSRLFGGEERRLWARRHGAPIVLRVLEA